MPFVNTDNAEIYYEVSGDGPPVVLAHGAGGNTLIWWQQVVHFAPRYKVITFDHRGWGRSRCEPGYRKARYFSDDLAAVLDDAGVERSAVVCQSMGGWTGMQFALNSPERVSCLVLSGTPAGVTTPEIEEARAERGRQRNRETVEQPAWNEAHWAVAKDAFENYPDRAFLYRQMSSLNAPIGDTGTAELSVDPERLRDFAIPTLMLGGENDRIFAPELLKLVAGLIPTASFQIIPVAGHSPYFETPDVFNKLVDDFLSRHAEQ